MFASAQLLHSWREKRPRNQDDLESSLTEKVGTDYYTEGGPNCLWFNFCTAVRDCCCIPFKMVSPVREHSMKPIIVKNVFNFKYFER
jgi:hypothetical protein